MADENEVKNEVEEKAEDKQEKDGKDKGKKKDKKKDKDGSDDKGGKSLLLWILIAVAVTVLSAGGGIAANVLLSSPSATSPSAEDKADDPQEDILDQDQGESHIQKDFAYYEFEPLVVNLDVQRQNRYIKVTIVLAIPKADEVKIVSLLDTKKAELKNWIMTYLAGHSLEQVAGRKNIVRIQREIADAFNEQLWPNRRPRINHVLFKDYAIQ